MYRIKTSQGISKARGQPIPNSASIIFWFGQVFSPNDKTCEEATGVEEV